jgi:hypothetical protein
VQTDAPNVVGYNWTATGSAGSSGHIEIDQLEFYLPSEAMPAAPANVVLATPKTNQVGYVPQSTKVFVIAASAASPGQAFQIQSKAGGEAVFEGLLGDAAIDDTAASGESVLQGDFSAFMTPGVYRVMVGTNASHAFAIAPDVYHDLFRAAGRTFYVIRSGEAIDDRNDDRARGLAHE